MMMKQSKSTSIPTFIKITILGLIVSVGVFFAGIALAVIVYNPHVMFVSFFMIIYWPPFFMYYVEKDLKKGREPMSLAFVGVGVANGICIFSFMTMVSWMWTFDGISFWVLIFILFHLYFLIIYLFCRVRLDSIKNERRWRRGVRE